MYFVCVCVYVCAAASTLSDYPSNYECAFKEARGVALRHVSFYFFTDGELVSHEGRKKEKDGSLN